MLIKSFSTAKAWEKWLAKNHAEVDSIQLQIYKKGTGIKTVTYDEALDVALCYGWIDGQKNSHDADSWLQRFTPRRAGSFWSKRNTEHVARLIKEKRMQPSGLQEVEIAKKNGRWDSAYDSSSTATVPEDFLALLIKNKKAKAFFDTLNKANRSAISYRLQTAKKPETRENRMTLFLTMMTKGKKFYE